MTRLRLVWQQGIQIGLIGGLVALLVALVGMVEAFSKRDIISGVISMGLTLVFLVMVFIGYLAARRTTGPGRFAVLLNSTVAGLTTSVLLVLLVIVGSQVNLRLILVNASPTLYELLTFKQGMLIGSLLLLAAGVCSGLLAGLFYLLPNLVRRVLVIALACVVLTGMLQDVVRPVIATWGLLAVINEWFFAGNGLTIQGAVTVFVLVAAGVYLQAKRGAKLQARYRNLEPSKQRRVKVIGFVILALVLLVLPPVLGLFLSEVMTIVGVFVIAGLGLNIVVGYAGLLDLGYVAFYAIGAYTVAVLTSPELGFFHLSFWEAFPVAIVMGILAGVILGIPVLKMRGDYLAIVTLGFGEIIRLLVGSDWLKPFLGGSMGLGRIPRAMIGGMTIPGLTIPGLNITLPALEFTGPQQFYYLFLVGGLILAFVAWRLRDSRLGRAWMAIREDEDVAQAMGINLVATKLLAFGAGAAFSAVSGAIFADKLASVYPSSFQFMWSINVLCVIIVGGMGSIPGVLVGAIAVGGLPELVREFADYRWMVYGALLVVMMRLRPQGLWPEAVHQRELREEPEEETAACDAAETPA
jgi:branched-chain amino acid transport system permease protein